MPRVQLVLFRDSDGNTPVLEWLDELQPKARAKCQAWLERLRNSGHELRRPIADYLRDGIYELRIGQGGKTIESFTSFTEKKSSSSLTA